MRTLCIVVTVAVFVLLTSGTANQPDNNFTGYATATVTSDLVEAKGVGFADKARQVSYTKHTVQPIGSVSKTFIGVSLLMAKDQGLIDLDADINEYLDFEVSNPRINGEDNCITLRSLATHTSGIIDNEKYYRLAYSKDTLSYMPLKKYLQQYLVRGGEFYSKKNFSNHKAGSYHRYSNIGAALAAHVLEKATGSSFSEFTKQNIFEPLGMDQSGWSYQEIDPMKHAVLYDEKDAPLEPYTLVTYPDGGLRTSAYDMSLYLKELIKGYNHDSPLLTNESWDELYRKNFLDKGVENINPREPDTGIFMMYSKSGKIGHTGSDPGVCSMMWFSPQTSRGAIFMANEDLTKNNVERFKMIWEKLK